VGARCWTCRPYRARCAELVALRQTGVPPLDSAVTDHAESDGQPSVKGSPFTKKSISKLIEETNAEGRLEMIAG
jgi:hypothetical protein